MTAGDVFPRRNLPDDGKGASAEPWGREVENRIEGAEASIQTLSQSLGGQNRSTASSLTDLASQVRDLQGRVGYSVDGTGTSAVWTSSQPLNQAWGPTLTFTITENRVVSIQSSMLVHCNATALNTSSSALSATMAMIFVNGSGVGGARAQAAAQVDVQPAPPARQDYLTSTLICRSLLTLPAGTHTVQGGFNYRDIQIFGSGSARIEVSAPNLFVDILQPAN